MDGAVLDRTYRPRGAAKKIFTDKSDEILLSGPAGTGKSRAALEKIHHICMLRANVRALIVRKTLVSLTSTAMVTYQEHVAKDALSHGDVIWFGGSSSSAAQFRYSNGSTITVGGMDKPTKIMSSEYDIIFVQEAIELSVNDWESLTTRLRNGKISYQQLIGDTNPAQPTHWLNARCQAGRTQFYDTHHEDNPILFGDDGVVTDEGKAYITKLDNLTGVRKERLRYGRWVAAEGLIYEEFDRTIHVKNFSKIGPPMDWVRYWSVDFGYKNPMVIQWWAIDHDGRLYMYRELYYSGMLVEDMAKWALKLVKKVRTDEWKEPKPRGIICDHDAEDRATFERHVGLGTIAATKTVSDGIQAVKTRLKVQKDGKPRLYIASDAVVQRDPELEDSKRPGSTYDEVTGYVWDINSPQNDGKNEKEVPLKQDDHGMDAMRYMVAELDLSARPRVRFI